MYFKQNYLSTIICLSLFALSQVSCAVRVLDKETITGGDRGELVVMDSKGVPLNVDPGDTVVVYENKETVYSPTNTVHLYLYHDEMPGSGKKPAPVRRRKLEVSNYLGIREIDGLFGEPWKITDRRIKNINANKVFQATFVTQLSNSNNMDYKNIEVRQKLPDYFTPEKVSITLYKPRSIKEDVPFSVTKDAQGARQLIVKGVMINKPRGALDDYNWTWIVAIGKYRVPEIKKGPSGK